ncbi:cell cycle protein mesJ [Mycolicibacterium canariasense]|uniref:tRNA(Ile)-lysidine synthase n=1 Tax=Mycolicibacterium canariasense TaxID=228230 RepID=A0A100WA64_MYCCR|nr:tRNA lysidine(34) synthetase TilS [Mycolicibacterium canariasense]MCV7208468.1 tRNA lysidine(34) synthetase TilS [Mycolicibacterium canariasense]ORV07421.1 tRNA(Ile)-lysidine synthetase [Mycolicibacterium canariasense]GAS94747.1 cell cycle protein mesJ [Mycolicibacterium canariasense]
MDRPDAVTRLRTAVGAFAAAHGGRRWCVALSGGADSLALTAVAATVRPTVALIVDHGLQPDSAEIAGAAHRQAMDLGCVAAQVITVDVGTEGGPEAAARTARYRALDEARAGLPVLLGHTLDDQAETVLLGLGRGSGARSIAGMRDYDAPWGRPLLAVRRAVTRAACAELGLRPWEDPHNTDPRFTRVRLRTEVLPLLEEVLGGGVADALARTAAALREDSEALDALAARTLAEARRGDGLDVTALSGLPAAVRRRVIRRWLLDGGARDLTSAQIHRVDALVTGWHGQGGVAVTSAPRRGARPARLFAARRDGMLTMYTEPV